MKVEIELDDLVSLKNKILKLEKLYNQAVMDLGIERNEKSKAVVKASLVIKNQAYDASYEAEISEIENSIKNFIPPNRIVNL